MPAVKLAAIEVRLDHVEVGVRDLKAEMDRRFTGLKGEMDRRFDDMNRRFEGLGRQLWVVTLPIGLLIAILQVVTLVSNRPTP